MMDIDGADDGTQNARVVNDYGVEVDFSSLKDKERQVCASGSFIIDCFNATSRMVRRNTAPIWKRGSRR